MRLSLAHATLLDLAPPDLVRVAAAAGYEAVGLRLIPIDRPGERRYALDENPGAHQALQRALDDTGIQFLDVEVIQIREGLDARVYLPALEAAAGLGCRFAIANVYTPSRAAALDTLGALCEVAMPLGISMALEFVSFSSLRTLAETVDLVRAAGHANAVVLVDALHFHSSHAPLAELAAAREHLAPFAHICDGPGPVPESPDDLRRIAREERLLPGEGGIDVDGIVGRLPADTIYAVEAHNPARVAAIGADQYARLAFEAMAKYLRRD